MKMNKSSPMPADVQMQEIRRKMPIEVIETVLIQRGTVFEPTETGPTLGQQIDRMIAEAEEKGEVLDSLTINLPRK